MNPSNNPMPPTSPLKASALLEQAARLCGQRLDRARFDDLDKRFPDVEIPLNESLKWLAACWAAAGLEGQPTHLKKPGPADLPLLARGAQDGWMLITRRGADGNWLATCADGRVVSKESLDGLMCIGLPRPMRKASGPSHSLRMTWQALMRRRGIFIDSALATGLVNLLALATSLYSMQVYDRVIPNQGFQTLWVLTVGVSISIALEFMLKNIRSRTIDRVCNDIDHELSGAFFQRMLGIRMEARPSSVGTLASQVKGFELVRGVLASTSLFVLADVPFAILFLLVIAMIGGWVAVVPLIALPIALTLGLMFQRAIQRHSRENLAASNRKAGLLVEAVDGAETLKAARAEWTMQSRWKRLLDEAMASEQGTRTLSALSQNLTVGFQQFAYIAMIAAGAYLVSENQLTMGGLLACSIISNKALAPIIQLPGVMVQWALARAALDGLDQIITMPNEADEEHQTLTPQSLQGELRLERVRFAYGGSRQMALEVGRLEIKPGERVGLVGPIGSGKSTLLKLMSALYRPNEGKVFLGGIDLATLAPAVARETIGYLPQEARLFSGTLKDNLLLGLPDPGEEAILAAARRTGLIDLILGQPAGLSLELTEGGRGVSGGQKQLIVLTRILLAKPKVWLLDEPTGSMDAATEAKVVNLLREVSAQEGITLVLTTHKTALLPLLERLVVMQGGRPGMDGPRDAVLAKISGRPPSAVANAPYANAPSTSL